MVAKIRSDYVAVQPDVVIPPRDLRRVSWGAIIAGVIIAIIIQVTMNMLGLAVGAGAVDPTVAQPNIGPALGTGIVVWLAATTLLGIFAGGYISAHLAGTPNTTDGMIHGLLTWALGTLVVLLMLSSTASSVFNGISSTLGQGISLIGANLTDVAPSVVDALELQDSITSSVQNEIDSLPVEEGASVRLDLPLAVMDLLSQDSESENAQESRQAVINLMTEQTTLTAVEAEARLASWEAQAQRVAVQVEAAAEEAASDLADAIAATAGVLFALLVVGAFAGGAGGYIGAPETIQAVTMVD